VVVGCMGRDYFSWGKPFFMLRSLGKSRKRQKKGFFLDAFDF